MLTRVETDGSFVAIDKAEEAAELIVSVPIGHRFPPDAPAQMRVRLAWMPEDLRRQELARWRPQGLHGDDDHQETRRPEGDRGDASARLFDQPG